MDAFKARDTVEPTFLFETLEAMNFGHNFMKYIKTIFSAPKAWILSNGIWSLLIFLFCTAVPVDLTLSKFSCAEHKVSLYADDL